MKDCMLEFKPLLNNRSMAPNNIVEAIEKINYNNKETNEEYCYLRSSWCR